MKTLGNSFVDTFSKNMAAEQPSLPAQNLSTKTGINKKKTTALQQSMLSVMSIPQNAMQAPAV